MVFDRVSYYFCSSVIEVILTQIYPHMRIVVLVFSQTGNCTIFDMRMMGF